MRKFAAVVLLGIGLLTFGCSDDNCPTCTKGPVLVLNKHKIDFGAEATTASFTIDNTGGGSMPWTLSLVYRLDDEELAKPAHGGWLETSVASGEGDATIQLTTDRTALDELGIARAVIIVNAPDAENVIRDSIEISVLNGGEWQIVDDDGFENCTDVDSLDYYWVQGFYMPKDQSAVFVDSIWINFCSGDTVIQLIGADAVFDEDYHVFTPNRIVASSEFLYQISDGVNVIPVDWYFTTERFYVGYFQLGSELPMLAVDNSGPSDTLAWWARDFSTDPGTVSLSWVLPSTPTHFAIRAFTTPVLEYNPKMAGEYQDSRVEATLRTGFAYKGKYPMSVQPQLPR